MQLESLEDELVRKFGLRNEPAARSLWISCESMGHSFHLSFVGLDICLILLGMPDFTRMQFIFFQILLIDLLIRINLSQRKKYPLLLLIFAHHKILRVIHKRSLLENGLGFLSGNFGEFVAIFEQLRINIKVKRNLFTLGELLFFFFGEVFVIWIEMLRWRIPQVLFRFHVD